MRKALMMIPLLFACAKSEPAPPATDTAPVAVALTEAEVAGTWKGEMMLPTSDSVIGHWTQMCAAGTCKEWMDGEKDTVTVTYMIMGTDSVMGSSTPFMDKMMKKNVTDNWMVHIKDGKITGTGQIKLADKPDSVVMAYRISGTKQP